MKHSILIYALFFICIAGYSQTDGLSYQAVIINPNVQELPGQDLTNNVLPNRQVQLRFTILNRNGVKDYQEVQTTRTDKFGMINVTIGQGSSTSPKEFTRISWDGTPKDLKVEVRLGGSFQEISNQSLNFIPYAFHRNITATGNLDVDGDTGFKGNLEVDGTTDLNSSLSVNNESPTNLTGTLNVDGTTDLNNNLSVNNQSPTNLTGTLNVDQATTLNNTLDVDEATTLNSTLDVDGATTLNSTLDVDEETTLNNTLDVDGATTLNDILDVDGATTLNSTLDVTDATKLNSTLEVDGNTTLNNDLLVTGQNPTTLTGTLTVDGLTNLNSDVNINNQSNLNVSGGLNVDGQTIFNDDLTVNGITNLNDALNVNNSSPTNLSGILNVTDATTLSSSLQVLGPTNLESELNVNNSSPTNLSGTLSVALETNLESSLAVNNGSPTFLSGQLTVEGNTGINNNLIVNGTATLNNTLFVNNGSATNLTGTLTVDGGTDLNNTLIVDGVTTLNNDMQVANGSATQLTGSLTVDQETILNNTLEVANGSATNFTGTLDVDGETTLNNTFEVTNGSSSLLSGELTVDGATTLNSTLDVTNGSATNLTGTLTVDDQTTLNNGLEVANASPTLLTGTLDVNGETTLNNILTANGATTINNDLNVTGNTILGNLSTQTINVQSDNANHVAVFDNLNNANGDGILIKLGRTHGAWTGSSIAQLPNLVAQDLAGPLNVLKNRLANANTNPTLSVGEIIQLAPSSFKAASLTNINNLVFKAINRGPGDISGPPGLSLPIGFPQLQVAGRNLLQQNVVFQGVNNIPFIGLSIPSWTIPNINLPTINIPTPSLPNPSNFIPRLPENLPLGANLDVTLRDLPLSMLSTSLSKENEYITFQDVDGRKTGTIRAQSFQDFADNTIFDDVYVLNVLSSFVGVDLLDGITAGIVEVTNLVDAYNDIGVEYSSGNGDYAEWLERVNPSEYLTAGDIVAVRGGQITRDLSNVEQIMVVSHKPIILGNAPKEGEGFLGNNVAFMGQVPVKIMGPVRSGDFIVASTVMKGYGYAKSASKMTADEHRLAVGRSWEENLKEGPKMVNTVVGVHNGDWVSIVKKIQQKQKTYETQYKQLEEKVLQLNDKANTLLEDN